MREYIYADVKPGSDLNMVNGKRIRRIKRMGELLCLGVFMGGVAVPGPFQLRTRA